MAKETKRIHDEEGPTNESYGCPSNDELGRNLTIGMNKGHKDMGDFGLSVIRLKEDDTVLDIGCGGGINLKRMAEKAKHITGIDISDMACQVSKEVNEEEVKSNKVEVLKADVSNYDVASETYTVITSFSSVYFWKDRPTSFKNIFRILKKGGSFYLVVSMKEKLIPYTNIPGLIATDEYVMMKELNEAGFDRIVFNFKREKGWIVIEAIKNNN
ncbi:class I SAM-dependent methyltransferase [Ureaplasma canigenitalium]|uniref:class I SAM-dependent methyltransferase n=1 Tax=Ureaplasma canigenitalium TaxID=42092 RepID=UPI0006908E90|nr:class I SAM-dependent methyltransferase [Ureaplasma canigenitalium]